MAVLYTGFILLKLKLMQIQVTTVKLALSRTQELQEVTVLKIFTCLVCAADCNMHSDAFVEVLVQTPTFKT